MRFTSLSLAALAAVLVPVAPAAPALAASRSAAVGAPAPAFALEGLDAETIASPSFAGKPLFVNVFATWCPPCRMEMPLISRVSKRYANRIAFLAVDEQESASIVRPYLKSVGVAASVAIDQGQFEASFGASPIPDSFFIDKRGVVRAIVRGPVDEATLLRDLALIDPQPAS